MIYIFSDRNKHYSTNRIYSKDGDGYSRSDSKECCRKSTQPQFIYMTIYLADYLFRSKMSNLSYIVGARSHFSRPQFVQLLLVHTAFLYEIRNDTVTIYCYSLLLVLTTTPPATTIPPPLTPFIMATGFARDNHFITTAVIL